MHPRELESRTPSSLPDTPLANPSASHSALAIAAVFVPWNLRLLSLFRVVRRPGRGYVGKQVLRVPSKISCPVHNLSALDFVSSDRCRAIDLVDDGLRYGNSRRRIPKRVGRLRCEGARSGLVVKERADRRQWVAKEPQQRLVDHRDRQFGGDGPAKLSNT